MKIYKLISPAFLVAVLSACIFFASTLLSRAEGNAEQTSFAATISMDVKNKSLRSVLQEISKQSGYQIVVSDDLLEIPITGNFQGTSLTALLGRILKGTNVFILEDDRQKTITVLTSLSKKEDATAISMANEVLASGRYSLHDLQGVQKSLDKSLATYDDKIESSPGVSYQKLKGTQLQLDQKLSTSYGKHEIEGSPSVTYQQLLNIQANLNDTINRENSGVAAASGVIYTLASRSQDELDTFVLSYESKVEASPGVSYKELRANQLKLDQQLTAHN